MYTSSSSIASTGRRESDTPSCAPAPSVDGPKSSRETTLAPFLPDIDPDSKQDGRSRDHLLGVGIDPEQDDAVLEHADDGRTENRTERGSFAANQTRTADDRGGDDRQFLAEPSGRLRRDKTGQQDDPGD